MFSKSSLLVKIVLWFLLLLTSQFAASHMDSALPDSTPPTIIDEVDSQSWIIQWKGKKDPEFATASVITQEYPSLHLSVARPRQEGNQAAWLERWQRSDLVEYIQPNHKVQSANIPNDPLQSKQTYLQQIHAQEAWDEVNQNDSIIIALVDTGVDLTHPDLKENLVEGVNLIHPNLPPEDDNGHGTNVAGVIAAVSNNDKGVAGIVWKAKIMPIKALEADGTGDENKLGEGIRYAVDHGAKIVVLSLGLNKYSPFMSSIVQYAEDQGVLLVAASGNEGKAVKYPAAYPTVLAVGGATADNQADERSNFGPELDVVAPWNVFTTAKGGRYDYKDGTSLAAPQVAAVCALLWSKYPDMRPDQVRNMIRQSAEDLGTPGWDEHTGYGLLRADRALTLDYSKDMYESNDTLDEAKPISVNAISYASLANANDNDWYAIEAPYDGTLHIQIAADSPNPPLELVFITDANVPGTTYKDHLQEGISLVVNKGKSFVKLQRIDDGSQAEVLYQIKTEFQIYQDPFEDNDRRFKAYVLPSRSQMITGTFHQNKDQDWFEIPIEQPGTLKIKLSVDTARIDPVLYIQKKGGKELVIDQNGDGATEFSTPMEVTEGTYFIRVSNIEDYGYPVVGEYSLEIELATRYDDPNEPNDKPFQASLVVLGQSYEGDLDRDEDIDWFTFKLDSESWVQLDLSDIPSERIMDLSLLDNQLMDIADKRNDRNESQLTLDMKLQAGAYYLRLTTDQSNPYQMYHLQVNARKMVAGYGDIANHWAEESIVKMVDSGVINGYGNALFYPDQSITRAEAAALLARAFQWNQQGEMRYRDVDKQHWAYGEISKATSAGIISGYPDRTFQPDKPISRIEMTVMMANVMNLSNDFDEDVGSFSDISETYWGFSIIQRMNSLGWVSGFEDGTFRPEQAATRAQFISLLVRIMNK